MIVITLSKVPPSLRGVLTKWCQEIQTGVYVGRFSARIRDALWDRIKRDIGSGEATIVFNAKNELGYQFRSTRADHQVVDFDGLPFLLQAKENNQPVKFGFSDAAKFRKAKKFAHVKSAKKDGFATSDFVALDIETTGLDPLKDVVVSIGAVKDGSSDRTETFYRLIAVVRKLPDSITQLTGITDLDLSSKGQPLKQVLIDLQGFVGSRPLVGYNIRFDDSFLSAAFQNERLPRWNNDMIDLERIVKKDKRFLDSYKLSSVLADYHVVNQQPHNALADAQATFELANKLIKNGKLQISNR